MLGRVGGVNDFVTVRYENSAWVSGFRFILVRNATILFHFPETNKFHTWATNNKFSFNDVY